MKVIKQELLRKIKEFEKAYKIKLPPERIIGIGKRGLVVKLDSKTCLKISKDVGFLKREYLCLKELNKYSIGPRVFSYYPKFDAFSMDYIKGVLFEDFLLKETSKTTILSVIYKIMDQLFTLDSLRLNKEEMHRPVKHIIIKKNQPFLIDFERCAPTNKPSNLSQFMQYLSSARVSELLTKKEIILFKKNLLERIRDYKRNLCEETLTQVKSLIWFYPRTSFEKIYTIARTIPKGKVATYSQIAKLANTNPRVVGFAMNKNKLWPVVPCHRVIGEKNLGGFSKGIDKKKTLLTADGISSFSEISKYILSLDELNEHSIKLLENIEKAYKNALKKS